MDVFVLTAFCVTTSINCSQPNTWSLLAALRDNIFNKTDVRPVESLQTPTNISIYFTVFAILDVDEKAQILETALWLELIWNIENLSWDPDECGASSISLPRTSLWIPDIVINEFMDENRAPESYYLYVNNNGVVHDSLPFHVISSCSLDIYTFPFDIQNCTYSFNSYKHNSQDVRLHIGLSVEEMLRDSFEVMETRGEWQLIDLKAIKPQTDYEGISWDTLVFYIVLKRRPTLYVVNLVIPSCFLLAVDLLSFLLPPQSVDRSSFKMTLILGYTVFLLLMNDLLPVTGHNIPLINVFFSICLALMVASLLETILITNVMCGSANYPCLPHWVRVLFLKHLARLVGLETKPTDQKTTATGRPTSKHKKDPSETSIQLTEPGLEELRKMSRDLLAIRQQLGKHLAEDQFMEEWILLGQVIDRLVFGLYVLFISVSFITMLVIWLHWYNQ
ncbi:5-hydroxytryptamine receptor 3E-like [Chanos chanos]|uniref:5-hydroxytryptamine receptor 3E-like n=1 Tax=Chanos chanos TaxID=29144 RepID=A0A6J2WQ90_CHACN|nr:5-hydroxytryptamine receptor 3E-like [Chanos chanos]